MKWINIKDKLPRAKKTVDIWAAGKRMADYRLVRNGYGIRGNDCFEPVYYGEPCVRFNDEKYYTQATHWMIPEPPKDN